jgi:hypothetical protein
MFRFKSPAFLGQALHRMQNAFVKNQRDEQGDSQRAIAEIRETESRGEERPPSQIAFRLQQTSRASIKEESCQEFA